MIRQALTRLWPQRKGEGDTDNGMEGPPSEEQSKENQDQPALSYSSRKKKKANKKKMHNKKKAQQNEHKVGTSHQHQHHVHESRKRPPSAGPPDNSEIHFATSLVPGSSNPSTASAVARPSSSHSRVARVTMIPPGVLSTVSSESDSIYQGK